MPLTKEELRRMIKHNRRANRESCKSLFYKLKFRRRHNQRLRKKIKEIDKNDKLKF